jgi:putative membrane protein
MKTEKKSMFEFENKERIILRDYLALERTRLANERTLFAYLRTSVYLILGGIAFLQLEGLVQIKWLGYLSLGLSVVFLVAGIFTYYRLKNKLKKYYSNASINPGENE